jgi:hypothetical protein
MFLNNNKTKEELISYYNINKEWLEKYEPIYLTFIERLKRNKQIEEELYNRFEVKL